VKHASHQQHKLTVPIVIDGIILPRHYDINQFLIMARDPGCLYAYWNIQESERKRFLKDRSQKVQWMLRVYGYSGAIQQHKDLPQVVITIPIKLNSNHTYIYLNEVLATFIAEIGIQTPTGAFHTILSSNELRLQAASVSNLKSCYWAEVYQQIPGLSSSMVKKKIMVPHKCFIDSKTMQNDLSRNISTTGMTIPDHIPGSSTTYH